MPTFNSFSSLKVGSLDVGYAAIIIVICWICYYVGLFAYRLSPLHPLHEFPGARLAAASYLYQMYFDIVKGGQYMFEIKRMHEQYGPIIRINPGEVHCADPSFMDEIYTTGSRKRDKGPFAGRNLDDATRVSSFGTGPHELHRLRRAPVTKIFSAASIARLEPEIHSLAQRLADKILATRGVFHVQDAMSCYATDVAALQVFGEPLGFVQQSGFEPNLRRAQYAIFTTFHLFTWCSWVKWAVLAAGSWLRRFMPEDIKRFQHLIDVDFPERVSRAMEEHSSGLIKSRSALVDDILDSRLPPHEKTTQRVTGEVSAILIAGTETTSSVLNLLTYHLLADPTILERLTAEVKARVDDPANLPPSSTLEQISYLKAVVLEGLRLSYGLVHQLGRVAPGEDLVYRGNWTWPMSVTSAVDVEYKIPRGYTISMSNWMTHHDEAIFPDSHSFIPERWLNADGSRRRELEKYMNSFSKGSRICLGMHLANCEVYSLLAILVLRVYPYLELYDSTVEDVRPAADFFMGVPRADSKGVRAVLKAV